MMLEIKDLRVRNLRKEVKKSLKLMKNKRGDWE